MKKAFGVLVGFVACGPLTLALPVVIAGAGNASATSASCPPGGGPQGVDSSAVAAQVEAILKGSSPLSAPSVAGLSKPDEQIPNAKTIQATGVAMRSRWPGRAGPVAAVAAERQNRQDQRNRRRSVRPGVTVRCP
ncbi:hypothetical protein [Kitasatospora sp. NPDC127116]|uniref:hypothetical protein n=1 Tax=Kitasatospora sp. NPDC127116 TaxID=3345367 RepID=UPI003387F342